MLSAALVTLLGSVAAAASKNPKPGTFLADAGSALGHVEDDTVRELFISMAQSMQSMYADAEHTRARIDSLVGEVQRLQLGELRMAAEIDWLKRQWQREGVQQTQNSTHRQEFGPPTSPRKLQSQPAKHPGEVSYIHFRDISTRVCPETAGHVTCPMGCDCTPVYPSCSTLPRCGHRRSGSCAGADTNQLPPTQQSLNHWFETTPHPTAA
jgi:hypothetical protein